MRESIRRAEALYDQERQEHEAALVDCQKEVEALEEKVETLRDPSAVETVMSKYQSQINDLSSLSKKHQEGNIARKQAVLDEFNHAIRISSEYKLFREKELKSLQKYLKSRQQFDVTLPDEGDKILSL